MVDLLSLMLLCGYNHTATKGANVPKDFMGLSVNIETSRPRKNANFNVKTVGDVGPEKETTSSLNSLAMN